jgi:hypothetical protein
VKRIPELLTITGVFFYLYVYNLYRRRNSRLELLWSDGGTWMCWVTILVKRNGVKRGVKTPRNAGLEVTLLFILVLRSHFPPTYRLIWYHLTGGDAG